MAVPLTHGRVFETFKHRFLIKQDGKLSQLLCVCFVSFPLIELMLLLHLLLPCSTPTGTTYGLLGTGEREGESGTYL